MSNESRDGLNEQVDGERLWKQRRGSEPIELLQRRFVRGAHDDRRCRVAQADPTDRRTRAPALVWTEADEIHDDQVGSQVCHRAIQAIHEREVIALIAQHLADEGAYVGVVLDDQDLSYTPHAVELGPGLQF